MSKRCMTMVLSGSGIALALAAQGVAAGTYSRELSCLKGLPQPMELKDSPPVGWMLAGASAGKPGVFVYREDQAFFVPVPPDARKYVDPKSPDMDPAVFVWAKLPRAGGAGWDHFEITLQGGKVRSWGDESSLQEALKDSPDAQKKIDQYLVKAEGIQVTGPEPQQALVEEIRAALPRAAGQYAEAAARDTGRRPASEGTARGQGARAAVAQLRKCAGVAEVKQELAAAIRKVQGDGKRSPQ
jgi:hypothetical protein